MEHLLQCSRCGSNNEVDVRVAVCGASTQWTKNNFPAPNTTETTYNNIHLWRLALCRNCLPGSYRIYLQKHMRFIAGQLVLYVFLGVLALTWWFFMRSDRMNVEFMQRLLVMAMVFSAFAGVIGVPVCSVLLLLDFQRLRALQHSGEVPVKRLDKSFVGEGQRIIEALMPHRPQTGENVYGEFPLPLQKTQDKKEMALAEESKHRRGFGKRDIVAVGKSLADLEKPVPASWKPLWAERKALL